MTDTCMGISRTCVFGKVGFLPDGHGFDDIASFSVDAMLIIDGVQFSL